MAIERPAFTIGIEEEYLLVDPATRDLVRDPGDQVMAECQAILGSQVSPEFLKAQVEVGTRVAPSVGEARDDLRRLRSALFEVVDRHGLALIAASTHPFADWADQQVTERDRYLLLAKDLQVVVRRLVICGMHVHVGIEDPELRIDLMNQASYFLPHLLALSTSSPFWHGMESGLKSYRMSVFHSLPRTGLPEHFSSWAEYERHVDALVKPGIMEDATKLWWDIRPSARYPTLEMRVSDVCTRLEDAMAVAAFYLCLLGYMFRLRRRNQRWRVYSPMLISENMWRAQRYGTDGALIDFGRGQLVPFADLVEEAIEMLAQDAVEFDVIEQLRHMRTIVREGTSAHRQIAAYRGALESGAEEREALEAVVDHLIEDTMFGL